jgi:3-hydroxyacyl-CoA dehydrogenase
MTCLADVDLVIEAVFEEMTVKKTVFETNSDRVCKPEAILASNTSYLNIDTIAGFTRRPADVVGLHFFSPANVMRLLEVVRGAQTAPDVLATSMAMAAIRKIAVVSGVCDGFIGNRMIARYGAAAQGLLNAGALPHQVDGALQKFGLAMGPFRMGDLAGLDIGWATRKRKAAEAGVALKPSVADRLCELGDLAKRLAQATTGIRPANAIRFRTRSPSRLRSNSIRADHRVDAARRQQCAEVVQRCIFALVKMKVQRSLRRVSQRARRISTRVYLNGYSQSIAEDRSCMRKHLVWPTLFGPCAALLRSREQTRPGNRRHCWSVLPMKAKTLINSGMTS